MGNNEASAMDSLSMFEIYGTKLYNVEKKENSLMDLTVGVSRAVETLEKTENADKADKVLNKFIDVFSNLAKREGASNDASHLDWLFRKCKQEMSKDTIIKFMECLKTISYNKRPLINFQVTIKNHSSLLSKLNKEDLAEVRTKLSEFEEAVKDLPVE